MENSTNTERSEAQPSVSVPLDFEILEEWKAARSSQSAAVRERRIAELILSRSDDEIISVFVKNSKGPNPWQAILDYVKALFFGLASLAKDDTNSRSAHVLLSTYVNVVKLAGLSSTAVMDKRFLDSINFLIQELEWFPKHLLAPISEAILARLEKVKQQDETCHDVGSVYYLLEMLPRCLCLVSSAESVTALADNGVEVKISGADYRESVLKRLLSIQWSNNFVTRIVSLLRELSLEMKEMEQFVRKLYVHMLDVEPQDLPSLVYQLLLLASKGFKRIVLHGMIGFFNKKHSRETTQRDRASSRYASKFKSSTDAFRQMEGTIVLHINFAVKQDPTLGQEWLYLVRTNSWPLTPFLVSVLLSISRIHRFEQQGFDLLRAAAAKSFKDHQRCRESRWAATAFGASTSHNVGIVEESFMRTVQSSAFGWDHIIPSVVLMGFGLIESTKPGRPKINDSGALTESSSGLQDLGIRVLSAAFEVHEMARDEIIEQCKCRIIGLKPQHSASVLRLIVLLVRNCPRLMLEHCARLKECLDYFTLLHASSASALLHAISPLLQLSRDLQDYTVLVLRKAMFGREESARVTAVRGLIDLVCAEKNARTRDSETSHGRFSEASSSQSSSQLDRQFRNPSTLLQDLLGLLRRCLSQQSSVKETFYRGLPQLLEADPNASDAVFDLIWPHFTRYFVSQPDCDASMNLESCVILSNEAVRVIEPLDHLLCCVHRLLIYRPRFEIDHSRSLSGFSESQNQAELGSASSGEALALAFQNLRKNLIKHSLKEFCNDKTLDFSSDSIGGQKNVEHARLLAGVVEVFMDSVVSDLVNRNSNLRVEDTELKPYQSIHDSLMQLIHQKQGRAPGKSSEKKDPGKKGREKPPRASKGSKQAEPSNDRNGRHSGRPAGPSGLVTLLDKREPFLSCPCAVYLLNSYVTHLRSKRPDRSDKEGEDPPANIGPANSEMSQKEADSAIETRVTTFALQSCLQHLNALSGADERRECFRTAEVDCEQLGKSLFQVILALADSDLISPGGSQNTAKGRGRPPKARKLDADNREGVLSMSLKCLEELIRVASKRKCLIGVIEQLDVGSSEVRQDEECQSDEEESLTSADATLDIFHGTEAKVVHRWLTTHCRPLLEKLLRFPHSSEIEVLCGIIQDLGSKLPEGLMKKHGKWAQLLCRGPSIKSAGPARRLASMAIFLSPPPADVSFVKNLGDELLLVLGTDEREPIDFSEEYPFINKFTQSAIGSLLLQKIESWLVDMEWFVSKLKAQINSESPQLEARTSLRPGASERLKLEQMLHSRMEAVMSVLAIFTNMDLSGALAEQVLRGTMHFYRCFAGATRLFIAPKGFTQTLPSPQYQRLAELTCKRLTASVYEFMSSRSRDQKEGGNGGKESVSLIKREGRTIPNLIFHIEESERYLLQLSKVSKVNLLRYAKRSTARDFRITDSGKKRKTAPAEQPERDSPKESEDSEHEEVPGSAPPEETGGQDEEMGEDQGEQNDVIAQEDLSCHEGNMDDTPTSPSRRGSRRSRSQVIVEEDDNVEAEDLNG